MTASGVDEEEAELDPSPTGEDRSLIRLVALSDGVFAIALTLLVLNLHIPMGTDASDVPKALRDLAPEFGAYALSFLVLGLFWLAHQRLYRVVVKLDHRLLALNLVYLGWIALIPFPTEVLGSYGNEASAVALYAAVLSVAGFMGTLLWVRVLRAGLAEPSVHPSYLVHGIWRGLIIGGIFLLSIPLTLVSPSLAEFSWLTVAIAQRMLARRFGSIYRPPRRRP